VTTVTAHYDKVIPIIVVTKPRLTDLIMGNKSLTYQEGQMPDTINLKVKFKLNSINNIKNCKFEFDRLKEEGASDYKNDFTIEGATLKRTGGLNPQTIAGVTVSGKTVALGNLTPIVPTLGVADEWYELNLKIKGTRTSLDNFCGGKIILKRITYDPSILGGADNGIISLVDKKPAPEIGYLDENYLPSGYTDGDNAINFTVYKVLNDQ
jgi:hypothetical protein